MSQTISSAPADRFALIIGGLRQAVARRCGRGGGLAGSLIILICSRLRRITARFTRYALVPSPILSSPEPVIATPGEARRTQFRRRPQPALYSLPRNRAWLLRLVPEAASGASQLRYFLADPEVVALLATAPQLCRILRPLCHTLGIRPAQALCLFSQSPSPPPGAPPLIPHDAPPPAAPIAVPPIGFSLDGAAQGSARLAGGIAAAGLPPPQNAPPSLALRSFA